MHIRLSDFNSRLQSASTVDQQMDCALLLASDLGFDAVIYDYSPVPVSHDGALITPSLLSLRNTPADWHALWCSQGTTRSTRCNTWPWPAFRLCMVIPAQG